MMKKIIFGIIAALLALGGYTGYKIVKESKNYDKEPQEVIEVIDGDTIKIPGGVRVRLLGINAPDQDKCYYSESRQFLKDFLEGKTISLQKDISGKDKYGRLLRYVILPSQDPEEDSILVNQYILRLGYAQAINNPPDNRYRDLFYSAQEQAIRENLGLWKHCEEYGQEISTRRQKDYEPIDSDCLIKGNISEDSYGKTYFIPGCDNYNQVKIDFRKGEQYFCTEKQAQDAGFRKGPNCP